MKYSSQLLLAILIGIVFAPAPADAQGGLVRKGVSEFLEGFAGAGAEQSAKELAEIGGERTIREVVEKAASQGGDNLVMLVVSLGKSNGPRAVKALEGDPALMTKALRGLPVGKVADAVIEASRQPALMAKLVRSHGEDVLAASARHPGIGTQVIEEFGEAGLKATKDLGTEEILILARTKGFRELPQAAQSKFISLLDRDPRAVTNLLRLAAGGTAIVLSADLVNKFEGEWFGKDGKPGRMTQAMVTYSWIGGGVLVAALLVYASIKLLGVWRKTKA
jgi:hypothetical protein